MSSELSRQVSLSGSTIPTLPSDATIEVASTIVQPEQASQKRPGGIRFWMIFVSLVVSSFLSAIDMTSVSMILPTIVADLNGRDFVWVGSAYTLASTAILPLTGGLSQIFGRRPIMLGSLLFFGLGSGITGGATNMTMLIAGRAIQGVGGGGILSLTEIIVADLVPLRRRGLYMGLLGAVWALASAVGPPIGGAFGETNWRWLFSNLPLTAIAAAFVFFFLRVKSPKDDLRTKMKRMDWTGNLIIIISSTITTIALMWGGVKYAWSSYQVLLPLVLGLAGVVLFFVYEANWVKEPVIPWALVSNRTSFSGYAGTFVHGIVSMMVIFYMPVYLQALKIKSPIGSGVGMFGLAFTVDPFAIVCGVAVAILKIYRPENYLAWAVSAIGVGLSSLLKADSRTCQWVGFQVIEGVGLGFLFTSTTFPILSALPLSETAHAMALFTFIRSFAQTWGITIGATVLQNELKKRLPEDFLSLFPSEGVEIAYAVIPHIPTLPEPMKAEVRAAFADSLRVIWYIAAGLCVLGFASVLLMKELPMHEVTDEDWGLEEKAKTTDSEKN